MAEQKETIILDFQVEQGDAISELEKTKKSIIELKKEQQELNKAYKAGNVTIDEYASESVRLEGILKKQSSSYNTLQKSASGVQTQFDKLIKANENLVKTNQQISGQLGGISESFKEFGSNVNVGGVSLGDLTGKMASFINPATAAAGAISGLASLYLSSAAGARDLESAQTQLSQSFTTISNDLARLLGADGQGGGLLSSLATSFNRIVFGIGASIAGNLAAGAQQGLKELELAEINAKAVAKRALDEAERFRRLRDDDAKALEDRKNAAEQVLGFINVREQALVNVQQERINNLKTLLALDKDNLNLQKEVRLAELELADIQEDSQGKRTEALNGINTLRKEEAKIAAENNAALAEELRLKLQLEQVNANLEQQTFTNINSLKEQQALIQGNSASAMKGAQDVLAKNIEKGEKERALAKQAQDIDRLVTQQKLANASMVLGQVNNLLDEESFAYKSFAIAQATIDTIRAATAALAPPPVGIGPFLGPILAATTTALGLANVAKIAGVGFGAAAGGGDFVTKGPQLLLVGDNPGGRERVTVEPLSGRGKTIVGKNMIAMAGGGTLETQSATSPINQAFAFRSESTAPVIVASWKEATELNTRIQFKEALVTK